MSRVGAIALALVAGTAAACAMPFGSGTEQSGTTGGSAAFREEDMVRTTLDNGLKVVLVEDHSAPVVALNVWVRTGSADEYESESGMAHVFEHMLFKGTEQRAVGEIARTVEAAGGNINAFTSLDMTVYHITMASRDIDVGIDVLADAIQNSAFDAEELDREKQVILEEIRRGEDSPGRVLFQALFDLMYEVHPYRRAVIGTPDHVLSFTRDGMVDFHSRWYVPNNMTFVAVGDFDSDATLARIEEAFAQAESRSDLAHPREPETPQSAPRATVVRRDFQQTLVGVAWPITSFGDERTAYLDLLAMVLGSGETSRLYRHVKDRARLVHAISASAYTPLDPGVFFIDLTLEPDKIEDALAATLDEVERMRAFGPSELELERARVNLLAGEVHEKETVQGQARKFGYYETLAGGLEEEAEYLERVRRATPQDLQRVAVEFLVPERANAVALLPEGERTDFDAAGLLAAVKSAEQPVPVATGTEIHPGIFRYELPNGLTVLIKRNTAVPLVSLRLATLGGLLAETAETQGLSSFLARMVEKGTEARSAAQIAAEVEGIAGDFSGFSGRNTFGLTASFLTESLDTGLELFADVLLHPSFPPDEIKKLKEERLAAIKRHEDNLASKSFDLFNEALYPDHPYRFASIGTEETISGLERDALVTYYERFSVPSNSVLAVVGDVEPDALIQALAAHLGDWTGPAQVDLPDRPAPTPPEKLRKISVEKQKQQVHIVMGFLGLPLGDPDAPALDVMTQILSGQGGRLFLELRDKKSLAYSVGAFSFEGVDPGAFGVYIASSPDKLDESMAGLDRELRELLDEPIRPDELDRARAYLIGTQAVSLQRYSAQAAQLALDQLYGLGATYHLEYGKRIEAVSIEDVRRVAERIILIDRPAMGLVK